MKRNLLVGCLVAGISSLWGQAWVNPLVQGAVMEPAYIAPAVNTTFDPVALGRDLDGDNVFYMPSLTIPAGAFINFRADSMRSRGPVIFVVTGDVTINGVFNANGENGSSINGPQPSPGPGGFGAGQGPGTQGVSTTSHDFNTTWPTYASNQINCAGVYAVAGPSPCTTVPYGSASIIPLVGGSGGVNSTSLWGGAGGGAVRIVAGGRIRFGTGAYISAIGASGNSRASGGAIHLVAAEVSCASNSNPTQTLGPSAETVGRVRVDASTFTGCNMSPAPLRLGTPTAPIPLPKPGSIQVSINGTGISAAATASYTTADTTYSGATPPSVVVNAKNIPPGTTVKMVCQASGGNRQQFDLGALAGTFDASTSTTTLTTAIQGAISRCAVSAQW